MFPQECRGSYPVVKCTYCRSEFQQVNKKSTDTICKKCAQNIKNYGMPKPCEYCSVIAAFIGTKCQKCSNSEKKYGPPHTCEQCKQKCAFDRKNDRKKVDGKLLCWLCTLSYKRVMQKAQKRKFDFISRDRNNSSPSNSPHSQHNTPSQNSQEKEKTKDKEKERWRPQQRDDKDHSREKTDDHRSKSRNKTGTLSTSSRLIDTGLPDQVVEVTRLREQVAQLKKSLDEKDRQILDKEKKARNRELQKQVSQLSRTQRPSAVAAAAANTS
ncbi:Protein FAM76A [Holothuria leucospilota]|uniref:Protein FAM76A n=1 Tax=Holothuria leucospilota TaxID=206669 RepID=A0A9Q1GX30_HOLLE|nr:Protein FAM76A [Holothuria leucospilota]